ncbi:MAG TPA: glucose-6-phosphate isomerase [bacterium]
MSFDFDNALTGLKNGRNFSLVTFDNLTALLKKIKEGSGEFIFARIFEDLCVIKEIKQISREIRGKFDSLIVAGIGGSSLGARCLYDNFLNKKERRGLKVFFMENIDSQSIASILDLVNPAKTAVNFISRSGTTLETVTHFFILREIFRKRLGSDYGSHFYVTTANMSSPLGRAAASEGYRLITLPPELSGRYSVLSPVGLLPASCAGIDIDEIIAGARAGKGASLKKHIYSNPALMGAAVNYFHYKKGKKIAAIMPYRDSLFSFGEWFAQIWAESLGKKSWNGIANGQTPIRGIGVQDQHSLMQLYLDGPDDKIVIFLTAGAEYDFKIKNSGENFKYLEGKTVNDVLFAEQKATEIVLGSRERPSWSVHMDAVSPYNMGALFFIFETMTVFAANLFKVNPFDQPAVEEIKGWAKKILASGSNRAKKEN